MIRVELAKQARRVRTWVSLGALTVIPIIATIANKLNPRDDGGPVNGGIQRFARSGGLNDALTALFFMSPFFLVVVASVFAGDTVAGEANWGTLRYLLLRPVRRSRLLASKLAVAGLMALAATLVIVVTGLVAGTIAFGWHPVRAGVFEISAASGSLRLALAAGYVAWGLVGVVSFAFLLSTLTDVPAGAFGGAIGLAIASQILDSFDSIGVIRNGLLTHYWQAWTQLFVPGGSTADMWRGALLQVPYALVFCTLALWRFQRKDILS